MACVSIAPAPDPKIKVTPGPCGPASPAGPYDVITGNVLEPLERPGQVDIGHCRADELMADNIELRDGVEPYNPLYILVRNGAGAQHDYGTSRSGVPRVPSVGGCP